MNAIRPEVWMKGNTIPGADVGLRFTVYVNTIPLGVSFLRRIRCRFFLLHHPQKTRSLQKKGHRLSFWESMRHLLHPPNDGSAMACVCLSSGREVMTPQEPRAEVGCNRIPCAFFRLEGGPCKSFSKGCVFFPMHLLLTRSRIWGLVKLLF